MSTLCRHEHATFHIPDSPRPSPRPSPGLQYAMPVPIAIPIVYTYMANIYELTKSAALFKLR